MKNCFMVNTLRHSHTGIQIKSVCIHSDLFASLLTSLNRLLVDIQREKCLCVVKRNSLMCEQVSLEWEILDKQIISYLSSFPPCRAPECGSRPPAWLCLPPSCSCQFVSTDVSSCLPSLSVGLWQQTMLCPYLVSSLPAWADTRYKDFTFNIRLAPSCRTWGKHYSFKVQFTFIELSIMVTFHLIL